MKDKSIIYISPYENKNFSSKSNSYEIQNKMSKGLLDMLQYHYSVISITVPIRNAESPNLFFKTEETEQGYTLGYINLFLIREVSLAWNLYKLMKNKKFSNKIILSYNFNPVLLGITFKYNKLVKKRKNKLGVFFLDPPKFYLGFNYIKNLIMRIWNKIVGSQLCKLDFGLSIAPLIVEDFLQDGTKKSSFPIWTTNEDECNSVHTKNSRIAVFAGNLGSHNDIELVLDAFAHHLKEYQLIVCGSGDLEQTVEYYSHKFSNISYKGLVSQEDINSYYQLASIVLAPRSDTSPRDIYLSKYGVSSKLSELVLTGKPVITKRVPSIPENISDITFCYEDIDSFVDTVRRIDSQYSHVIRYSMEKRDEFYHSSSLYNLSFRLMNFLEDI